jgi:hypothetical protein
VVWNEETSLYAKDLLQTKVLQANGLPHTSPGQRPGSACDLFYLQANGLLHLLDESRFQRWK